MEQAQKWRTQFFLCFIYSLVRLKFTLKFKTSLSFVEELLFAKMAYSDFQVLFSILFKNSTLKLMHDFLWIKERYIGSNDSLKDTISQKYECPLIPIGNSSVVAECSFHNHGENPIYSSHWLRITRNYHSLRLSVGIKMLKLTLIHKVNITRSSRSFNMRKPQQVHRVNELTVAVFSSFLVLFAQRVIRCSRHQCPVRQYISLWDSI